MKKDLSSPVGKWIIIAACFILGVLDMIMLRDAVRTLLHMSNFFASVTAFALATVANFTALMWGRESGQHSQEKSLNKYSIVNFLIWTAIGIFYMVIRVTNIITNSGSINVVGEVIQMLLLVILYISTGLTISAEARVIFDGDVAEYRKIKKEFEFSTEDLADEAARIQEQLGILEKYDRNYVSLDLQKNKISASIYKAEESTMADIVGKTVAANPEITPSEAHKVMEEVLDKRDTINEKLRSQKQ